MIGWSEVIKTVIKIKTIKNQFINFIRFYLLKKVQRPKIPISIYLLVVEDCRLDCTRLDGRVYLL